MSPASQVSSAPSADTAAIASAKTPPVVFRPRKRLQVPWAEVSMILGGLLGLYVAFLGVQVLRGDIDSVAGTPVSYDRGIDVITVAFLIASGPVAYHSWQRRRRLHALDSRLPDFLADVSSLHKAGLTLQDSITTAAQGDYGPLTQEVRFAADQVRWNIPVLTVLDNFRRRIGTPIAERTLAVVIKAAQTGGNVPEVLEIATSNLRAFIRQRDTRQRAMGLYTIVTYVASLIFVGVALAMNEVFIPKMIGAFEKTSGAGLGLASSLPTREEFRILFYSAGIVQAIGNGLVGGIMSDGRALSGLRHSWAMGAACFLGFMLAE